MHTGFIKLEHGAVGKLTRELIQSLILPKLSYPRYDSNSVGVPEMDDGASIPLGDHTLILQIAIPSSPFPFLEEI